MEKLKGLVKLNNELLRYCSNCNILKHKDEANYCYSCGSKLSNAPKREFYLGLHIPQRTISLAMNVKQDFKGFPFLLWRYRNNEIQVITMREYPKVLKLYKRVPMDKSCGSFADKSEYLSLNEEIIKNLMDEGFEWFHFSEKDTLW